MLVSDGCPCGTTKLDGLFGFLAIKDSDIWEKFKKRLTCIVLAYQKGSTVDACRSANNHAPLFFAI